MEVKFPYEVEMTQIGVHSQHSGEYHAARAVRVAAQDAKEQFRQVAQSALKSADDKVTITKTKSRVWRFEFQAWNSQSVTLRGRGFFSGADELFPTLLPVQP